MGNNYISYSEPTHADQYLQWDNHHNLAAKYSVISTLTNRVKSVFTKPELLNKEIHHLRKALAKCKYPKWALNKIEMKLLNRSQENSNTQRETSEEVNNDPSSNTTMRDPKKDKNSKDHIVTLYVGARRKHQEYM